MFDYDLIVIGGGSGGVRAARQAAALGIKVALCEDDRIGGTCVIRGCIPKKLMVYASRFQAEHYCGEQYGWEGAAPTFHWEKFKGKLEKEIQRLSGVYENLLKKSGVHIFQAHGKILDPQTVSIGEKKFRAKNILICTGGVPVRGDIPGATLAITSNEAFGLKKMPAKIVIVGAGYIALEFAGIFRGLGAEVDVLVRGPRILNKKFDEISALFLQKEMEKKGIKFHLQTKVQEMSVSSLDHERKKVVTDTGKIFEVDEVLLATGRAPRTHGLWADEVGVKVNDKGAIHVDEHYQTSVPSIYALGDCTDRMNLTPVALGEAMVLVNKLFGDKSKNFSYHDIPTAIFSWPEMASVGLTAEEAIQEWGEIEIYQAEFRPLFHTLSGTEEKTLMRMMVAKSNRRVVGLHMVGKDAAEVIQGFAVGVRAGLTKEEFDQTVGIHPSSGEEFVTMRVPL